MKAKSGDFEFEGTPDEIVQVTLGIVQRVRPETKKEPLIRSRDHVSPFGPVIESKVAPASTETYKHLMDPQGRPIPRGVIDPVIETRVKTSAKTAAKKFIGTREEQALKHILHNDVASPSDVAKELGVSIDYGNKVVRQLLQKKQIKRVGRGQYRILAAGKARVRT